MNKIDHRGLIDFCIPKHNKKIAIYTAWMHMTSESAIRIEKTNWKFFSSCGPPVKEGLYVHLDQQT